jgi:hypothetical protein
MIFDILYQENVDILYINTLPLTYIGEMAERSKAPD